MVHLAPISDNLKAGAKLLVVVGEPLQQRHVLLQLHLHTSLLDAKGRSGCGASVRKILVHLVSVEGLVFFLLRVEEEDFLLPACMVLQCDLGNDVFITLR